MTNVLLEVDGVDLGYVGSVGLQRVVENFSLRLEAGEIGCLLGASGCGKTTVLRAIAGFEPLRAGRIVLAGDVIASAETHWLPEQRRVGMVFQDYALFPHLDVAANIAFGLRGLPKKERGPRVEAVLEHVGMQAFAARYPHELSGGQQQRIALARALAPRPKILLLDEPFSNLDIHTRARLAAELRGLLKAAGTTALLVTHDQGEAFAMADRIGVMDGGTIRQWADAKQLYEQPAHRHVAGFIGRGTLVPATALGLAGTDEVLVRPEDLLPDGDGRIHARLKQLIYRGPGHTALLQLASGQEIHVDLPDAPAFRPGDDVRLRLARDDLPRFSGE